MDKNDWCFIYKGDYDPNRIAGVEARYLSLAYEAKKRNESFVFVSNKSKTHHVSHRSIFKVINVIFNSRNIILHGGGPILLTLLSIFSVFFGRKVVLDAYAPHWLELYSSSKLSIKLRLKLIINISRVLWAAFFFDRIIVANKRQKDLVRGFLASCGLLNRLEHVTVITTGSPEPLVNVVQTQKRGKFLFGWLGGMWDWFNIEPFFNSLTSLEQDLKSKVVFVFYGVSDSKKEEIDSIAKKSGVSIQFRNWVKFENRIEEWSGLDAAFVWSEDTLENDYASRTRNFDCISSGLPIIQNFDDFWGPIITNNQAGLVIEDPKDISSAVKYFCSNENLKIMRNNIYKLYEIYSWESVKKEFDLAFQKKTVSLRRAFFVAPLFFYLVALVFSIFLIKDKSEAS